MLRGLRDSSLIALQHILRSISPRPLTFSKHTSPTALSSEHCWKCGQKQSNTHDLFCDACSIIQRPKEKDNYFTIFQLPVKFGVDVRSLQQQYRTMLTQLHPDKFANKSADEKEISAEFSSLVNNAYNTLSNPMARALHMLKLHQQVVSESDKLTNSNFLMHIMELNEELDNAHTEEELWLLKEKNDDVMAQIVNELQQKFDDNDIISAKQLVIRMKYFYTLSLKIKENMANNGIVD